MKISQNRYSKFCWDRYGSFLGVWISYLLSLKIFSTCRILNHFSEQQQPINKFGERRIFTRVIFSKWNFLKIGTLDFLKIVMTSFLGIWISSLLSLKIFLTWRILNYSSEHQQSNNKFYEMRIFTRVVWTPKSIEFLLEL